MSTPSGAGARAIGDVPPAAVSGAASKGKKGSAKKKPKGDANAAAAASTNAAAAAPAARVDHLSAASAANPSLARAVDAAASLAAQSAFPTLHATASAAAGPSGGGFVPDEDADEEIDEEKLRAQMAEALQEEEATAASEAHPLTLEIIRQRCLPREVLDSDDPKRIDAALLRLERVHLDGLSLNSIDDCFDLMSHTLTHVYLQRNQLTSSLGFQQLRNLRFLTLAHNRIRVLEGMEKLEHLQFLDVSHNLIDELDTGGGGAEDDDDGDNAEDTCQIPASLVVLRVAGNPFVDDASPEGRLEIQEHIVTVSPYLKRLDGVRITNAMRRQYGLEVDDEEEEEADEQDDPFDFAPRKPATAVGEDEDEDEEDDGTDDDDVERAAASLRAETEAMRKRSEQRTKQYDDKHNVSEATTAQDRVDALEAAAAAATTAKVPARTAGKS
jgi:hypothetical protein